MSTTFTQTLPITSRATSQSDLPIVCLLSALGLTLSATILSYVSPETASMMVNALG